MSNLAHEVFDTNYDYHYASEQRKSGEKGIVQKLGERAVKWFRGMNEKRKAEKAERTQNGSLSDIKLLIEPAAPKEAQQVEPGVYRSSFSGEQPAPELSPEETDDIMARAVIRARKNLGALPVMTLQHEDEPDATPQPETATPYRDERNLRDAEPGQDEELLRRLRRAYEQPAVQPDRSDHTKAEDGDDELVSTKGK